MLLLAVPSGRVMWTKLLNASLHAKTGMHTQLHGICKYI